jgi:hypothetical protein
MYCSVHKTQKLMQNPGVIHMLNTSLVGNSCTCNVFWKMKAGLPISGWYGIDPFLNFYQLLF